MMNEVKFLSVEMILLKVHFEFFLFLAFIFLKCTSHILLRAVNLKFRPLQETHTKLHQYSTVLYCL
jgi:hypothetical protein